MIKTATQKTRHGDCTPDIHRLLAETWERAKAEKEDENSYTSTKNPVASNAY